MQTALNIVLNVVLAGCCVLFLSTVIFFGLRTDDPFERILRSAALMAGALVVLVSQVSGASYAQFTLDALGGARPGTGFAKAVSTVLPGLVGLGMGYYITNSMQHSETKAIRLMSFIGMLAAAQFTLLYGLALNHRGIDIGNAALPNATFVVGIVLYMIFKLEPEKIRRRSRARRFAADSGGSPLLNTIRRGVDQYQRKRAGAEQPSETPSASEPS